MFVDMDVLYLQDTKTEMEKQKREHQESSANLAAKHSQELKDLGKTRISVMTAQKHGVQAFVRITPSLYQHIQSCPAARS